MNKEIIEGNIRNSLTRALELMGGKVNLPVITAPLGDEPLQKISYGAPGTGKSHKTNEIAGQYADTIRTTFHPDSDYSTFVGCYKPTTTEELIYGLNGDKTVVFKDLQGNPIKTSKIEYKFIKQAFLKAYILAWQKMCDARIGTSTSTSALVFGSSKATYTIENVDSNKVTYKKEEEIALDCDKVKKAVLSVFEELWESGTFIIPTGAQSGKSFLQAISQWIHDLQEVNIKEDFEIGWNTLIAQLKSGKEIKVQKKVSGAQTYILTYNNETNTVTVTTYASSAKDTISKCYNGQEHRDSPEEIAKRLREYGLPTFEEAWERLANDVNNSNYNNNNNNNNNYNDGQPITIQGVEQNSKEDEIEPQFLVIEEINRGNCAQIFGDIFQLLDRKENYSEYPIEADEDIQKALLEENPADGLSFGKDGLQLPDAIVAELQKVFAKSGDDVVEKICKGKVLVLPKNLYIWATMNTSDQSLFPIDSAFKRRWDWKYVPIVNHEKENWKIQIGEEEREYDWWTFLTKVNDIINELTSSEDKKLGYFFAKAKKEGDKKVVDLDTMVNKVFFYLWNDVFKDYDLGHVQDFPKTKDTSKTDSKERPYSFGDFFDKVKGEINEKAVADFMNQLLPTTDTPSSETAPQEESTQ